MLPQPAHDIDHGLLKHHEHHAPHCGILPPPTTFCGAAMNDSKEPKERKKRTEERNESQQPVEVIRRGAVAASSWQRQAPSGYPYYYFSICRSWKSLSSDRTGYSKNFFAEHSSQLVEVIQATAAWIEAKKSEHAAAGVLAA